MITSSDVLIELRVRIRDEGKIQIGDDGLLLIYINEAINWLSNQLIALQEPIMIVEADITDGEVVPIEFVSFVGQYPLRRTGSVLNIINDDDSVTARYWAEKAPLTVWTGTIDFPTQYKNVLVQYATIAALNKLGKGVDQDSVMFKSLNDLVTQARGKVEQPSKDGGN